MTFLQHLYVLIIIFLSKILIFILYKLFLVYLLSNMLKKILNVSSFIILSLLITSCGNGVFKKTDARKVSPDPRERVKKNIEEGKGFRLSDSVNRKSSTNYDFATSNELWRASLDILDFMPLTTANYSGGIIVTDWYSENNQNSEFIKISVRFLTNEIRSDAIDVKVFYKVCETAVNCSIKKTDGKIKDELTKNILKKAVIYKNKTEEEKSKNSKPYIAPKTN